MQHVLLLFFLFGSASWAEQKPWPREFKARPLKLKVTTDAKTGDQVATTQHYRLISETKINLPDFERFATVLESVPYLIENFPIPLWAPPSKKGTDVFICKDRASYTKRGGSAGSVGWYNGYKNHSLILASYFLNPPTAKPTRLRPRPNQDILVHEMIHMSMHGLLPRTPPWFYEGVAEYFSVCHQGNGWYIFRALDTHVRDQVKHGVPPHPDGTIHLLSVKTILNMHAPGWLQITNGSVENPYLPYATGLLLAHYHFSSAKRREAVSTHLEKLHKLTRRDRTPTFPTEDAKVIQERLVKYWAPRGLNLVFEK